MAISGGGGGASAGAVRAGGAFVELFAKNGGLIRVLDDSMARVRRFGLAVGALGAVSLAKGLVGGKLYDHLTGGFRDAAVEAGRFATRLGVSVERLTALEYAARSTGQSSEDLAGHFENLAERIDQGARGTGEAITAFQRLGLDPSKLKVMDVVDQVLALNEAVTRTTLSNTELRGGILSALGGDKFQGLTELLTMDPGRLRALMGEAQEVGAVLSGDEVRRATEARRELDRTTAALTATTRQLGAALLPSAEFFHVVRASAVAASQSVRGWIAENREAVNTAGDLPDVLTGVGVALVAAGGAVVGLTYGLSGLVAAVGFLLTPMGAAAAAVAALTFALTQTDSGRAAFAQLGQDATAFGATFSAAWGGVKAALQGGDLKLAGEVAMAGLRVAMEQGMVLITNAWRNFGRGLSDVFLDSFRGIRKEVGTLTSGVAAVLIDVLNAVGVYSDKEAKQHLKNLWQTDSAERKKAESEAEKARAERVARRAAEDAELAAKGNPALADAQRRLDEAVRRAEEARRNAPPLGGAPVNAPGGPAPAVGVAARGAFGANLANQLGTGNQPWVRAQLQAAKNLTDINVKMDRLIDVSRDRKAVFS